MRAGIVEDQRTANGEIARGRNALLARARRAAAQPALPGNPELPDDEREAGQRQELHEVAALDVLVDGSTIYPSFAVADQRPAWAFDASSLTLQGGVHEVTELHQGQLVELVSIEHPTGGTPARAEAVLVCRRT